MLNSQEAWKPESWEAFKQFEPPSFTEADSNNLKIGSVIPTEWAGPPSLKLF
jgi:hypothetical protein